MPSSQDTPPAAKAPRPSASLVIINGKNEVLLVHRNPQSRSFGGVHVFPGGNFDPEQDDSLAMTAIRETFEESGILIASPSFPSPHDPLHLDERLLNDARQAIHGQTMLFKTFLTDNHLQPDISSLGPFTEWITPVTAPRRFHAQFFVTFLPDSGSLSSVFWPGTRQDRIPTPDGGQEVISARFVRPEEVLTEFRDRKITLMPPQFYILTTLVDILVGQENTHWQREQINTLSRGAFGRMVINPVIMLEGGRATMTYEGDETRGGSKGRLHRVSGVVNKAGIPVELHLMRNFDIFTELEPGAFGNSKL